MNALVGRRGGSGRRARRIIRVSIERHGTAARLISLERAASTGGRALAIDERSTARHALIDARATVTVGDNAIPNAQSALLSEHNSHGGLFLRRFRNAPDAASATTTFPRQGRLCDSGIFRNGGVFCIQGLCEALYHERVRFLLVLAQICGCERRIFRNVKNPLQKTRSEAWHVSRRSEKPISETKKIVHNCKFVPELPKSGHVFGKARTKGNSRAKRRPRTTQTSGARLPYRRLTHLQKAEAHRSHTWGGADAPSGK